ncbi:MAG: caspase family protein [Alphaproteobacteria bacterium]
MTAGRSSNPAAVRGVIAWSFLALLVAPAPAHAADPLYLRIESGMHSAMINRIAPIGGGGLVTVSNDKTVRLWNADGSARAVLRPAIGAGDAGALYALAAAGSHLAVAGQPVPGGAMITLIDINELRQLGTINMPSELGAATAAAFLADGALLAVGFEHGGLRLLDLAQAKVAGDDKDYAGGVTAITADGRGRLAVSAGDGVRLYATGGAAGKPAGLRLLAPVTALPDKSEPWGLTFSPNGRRLAVGSFARPTVWLLDGATLAPQASLPGSRNGRGGLAAVAWSADGRTLYAGGGYADPEGRPLLRVFAPDAPNRARDIPLAGNDTVTDLAALADGGLAWAAAGPSFGRLDATGNALFVHEREQGDFRDLYQHGFAVSEDGSRVDLTLRPSGTPVLEFDLRARKLAPIAASAPDMTAPAAAAGGLAASGWRNDARPALNGRPLVLEPNEIARSVAVAGDGSAAALGSDFYLRLYRGGNQIWQNVLPAPAWTVGFSGDRRYVVAALGDGTLRWYAATDGSEVMALFVHSDGRRWIVWTPDGYFDDSPDDPRGPGGESLIGYHIDHGTKRLADFVTVDQMYDRFYRRDVVLARFTAAAAPPPAGEAPVEKALGRGLPPRLALDELCEVPAGRCQKPSSGPIVVTTPEVLLKLRLEDRGGGIGDVLVRRDGAVIEVEKQGPVSGAGTVERRLPLAPGTSRIELSALTANGAVESGADERPSVSVDYTPPPPPQPAAPATRGEGGAPSAAEAPAPAASDVVLYILAVGVSKYALPPTIFDWNPNLDNPANDAKGIADIMEKSAGEAIYQKAVPIVLTDEEATIPRIEEGFHALAANARPQDMVLVFFAGHGESVDGRYYFAPHEIGMKNPERLTKDNVGAEWDQLLKEEGIGQDQLVKWIRGIAAAHVLIMLDTCFSGSFAVEDATSRAAQNVTVTSKIGHSAGRMVLAGADKEAFDAADAGLPAYQHHGVFTSWLLQGLDGAADLQKRGEIDVADLARYVTVYVPNEAKKQGRKVTQEASFYFAGGEFFDLRALPKAKQP